MNLPLDFDHILKIDLMVFCLFWLEVLLPCTSFLAFNPKMLVNNFIGYTKLLKKVYYRKSVVHYHRTLSHIIMRPGKQNNQKLFIGRNNVIRMYDYVENIGFKKGLQFKFWRSSNCC